MTTDAIPVVAGLPTERMRFADPELLTSHVLLVGDQPLKLPAASSIFGLFRELSGHGIPAEQFPMHLRGVSKQLFGNPKAINVGTPLKFVRSNGEVQLAASVGSALVQLPVDELALA